MPQKCYYCNHYLLDLDPYEHLKHFFQSCTVHFKWHIHEMPKSVPPDMIAAMLSLSTTEELPDLEAVFDLIHSGGKKAACMFL